MSEPTNTKNLKEFDNMVNFTDDSRILGIGDVNIGNGVKITMNNLLRNSVSSSDTNLLVVGDDNKLYVPKSANIEFNNPFSFGDFKYTNHIVDNLSWLRSQGQRNSGTLYEQYYNWLLSIYNGSVTVTGITVKSASDTTATDYDYKIDTSNREFILPTETVFHPIDSSNNIPVVGNGMTLGLTDGTNLFGSHIYDNTSIGACCGLSPSSYGKNVGSSFSEYATTALKNVGVTTDPTKSGIEADLSSAKATAYLYYFVGEVVQNADIIDVAKMQEQIVDLSTQIDSKADGGFENISLEGRANVVSWLMPDYTAGISAPSGFIAPKDGWVRTDMYFHTENNTVYINQIAVAGNIMTWRGDYSDWRIYDFIPISKGSILTYRVASSNTATFYPCKGVR